MKTIIIYTSATGFTKKYAQWLSEETGIQAVTLKEAKKMELSSFERIVYGGWIHASLIAGINDICKMKTEKQLLIFAVGGAPVNKDTLSNIDRALPEALKGMKITYCPGGMDFEDMKLGSRLMMKMFAKMLKGKKDKSPEDEEMAKLIQHSYDISDKKYIMELAGELK